MKLEFIKDSSELIEFEKTLKWKDSINLEFNDCGDQTYYSIYFQESSNKYYKVERQRSDGVYSKSEYIAYRRNFKISEPWVVNFYEVKPVEVARTEWVDIEED